jgi:hypothetical protein
MKAYISQKQAKLKLRAAGFSVASADKEVKALKKHPDGKREKVKLSDVERIIREAAAPTPVVLITDPKRLKRIERMKKRLQFA